MSAAAISTHGVMEGGGAYNLNAKVPAGGGTLALPYLEKAARSCALLPGGDPIVIADYGSSQGKNSLAPMRAAIRCLRARVGCARFDLPDAAWADYQRDGNVQALVSRHAAFFRAVFVPSLASTIEDADSRQAFANGLEQKLKQRLRERPAPFHSFVQVIVVAKQGYSIIEE